MAQNRTPLLAAENGFPKLLTTASLLIVTIWGIHEAESFLVPLSFAALLAFSLVPLVRLLRRSRVPEWAAILLTVLIFILPFVGLGYLLARETETLIKDFPQIVESSKKLMIGFSNSDLGQRLHVSEYLDVSALTDRLAGEAGRGLQLVMSGLAAFLSAGSHLLIIVLFAVLMLMSREHLRIASERILALHESLNATKLLEELVSLIERFLTARFLIVAIVGLLDMVILKAMGINYATLMGGFLGLMTLIPAVGFIIGVIPPLILSLATGHSIFHTGLVLAALGIVSGIESHFLSPKWVGTRLNLNLLATFVGLFGGELLWGIWGMFLSVPILGILRIAFSASPRTQPWGELLAEREDHALRKRLIKVTRS